MLRGLRDRGLRSPLLVIADGNLGIWAALSEVFPTARRQRCWNHRLLNLKDKLPKRLRKEASPKLYELYQAPTRERCESLREELEEWLRHEGQASAAQTLGRDWEDFVTFYDFPQEHWLHIRTTDEIVKPFGGRLSSIWARSTPLEKSGGWGTDLRRASGLWPHSRFPVGAAASFPVISRKGLRPLLPVGGELAVFGLSGDSKGSITLS